MIKKSTYGLIGNGETAALVGEDLAVAWLCVPRFDRIPIVAGALDPIRGGRFWLGLADERGEPLSVSPVEQAYLGSTALLRTVVAGSGWRVESTDFMPWGRPVLVREIRVVKERSDAASVRLIWGLEPIRSAAFPVAVREEAGLIIAGAPGGMVAVAGPDSVRIDGDYTVRQLLGYGATEEQAVEALQAAAGMSVDTVASFWQGWIGQARQLAGPEPLRESYYRSLITLKLLTYEPTGAILAAPTASFPAVPGGSDNWDYRYMWLRDGYYTAITLNAAGLHDEARRFYDFAFSLQGENGHWRQPLYTVDGADAVEFVIDDLRGPGGEAPIRFGNAAAGQLQLDNEGNMVHGVWFHYRSSGDRATLERHWNRIRRACEWTAANWRRMESGIWELREYVAHWVHGQVMCHVGLKAGALIAGVLGHTEEADRWMALAQAIRTEVVALGWNAERGAYLAHYGSGVRPHVDVSALALAHYGLLPPDDPRIVATVRLMERPQEEGGLMLHGGVSRYDWAAVPFYLPTVWLARYYLLAGRQADCDRLLQTCLDCATDLGLMAEHFDGRNHAQWGNFPQGFSHEEVARLILERADGRVLELW